MTLKDLKPVLSASTANLYVFREEDLSHPVFIHKFDLDRKDFDDLEVSCLERGVDYITIDLIPPNLTEVYN